MTRKLDIPVIRESIAKIVSLVTKQNIRVTQRGTQAYVKYDKKTGVIQEMNIPHIPDDATESFVMAIQGFVDHEVGHVLFSDVAALKEANKHGTRVANVANMLEDVFVERKMAETFFGSNHNLDVLRGYFFDKMIAPQINEALKAGDSMRAQGAAMVAAMRAWGGQTAARDFIAQPHVAELVKPLKEKLGDLTDEFSKIENSMQAVELALKVKRALEEPAPPASSPPPASKAKTPEPAESDPEDGEAPSNSSAPAEEGEGEGESGEPSPEEEPGTTEVSNGASEEEQGDGEEEPATSGPGEIAHENAEGEGESEPSSAPEPTTDEGGHQGESEGKASGHVEGSRGCADDDGTASPLGELMDQEYDFDKSVARIIAEQAHKEVESSDYPIFSTEWDRIEPANAVCRDNTIKEMEEELGAHVNAMTKSLERAVAAQDRKVWNPGQRRGRLSPGSLYRVPLGNDRIFRTRTTTRAKNTAVELVIDCSGSMYGAKIRTAAEAALAMSTTLERIKVKNEVIGFTTKDSPKMEALIASDPSGVRWARTEPIYMPIFKSFDQRLDVMARKRLGHLRESPSWLGNNIDGESIRTAAHRLRQQDVERRIMIVFSDGRPAGSGYGYASHLKKSVKEIEASGIEVIGIGIQDASVKSFYSKNVVISNVSELPERVIGEISKMLLA